MTAKKRGNRSKMRAPCQSSPAAATPLRKPTAPNASTASDTKSKTSSPRQRLAAHRHALRQACPQLSCRYLDDWHAQLDQAMSPDPSYFLGTLDVLISGARRSAALRAGIIAAY